MSIILEQVEDYIWDENLKTKCVRAKVGIYNQSDLKAHVLKLNILNKISNPQEPGSINSFAFHFGDPKGIASLASTDGLSFFEGNQNKIDYPNHYMYEPSNKIINTNTPILSNRHFYNQIWNFKIDAWETFWFYIQFSPYLYNIDFFMAHLNLEVSLDDYVYKMKWPLRASLIPNIKEINHKSFPDEVYSIEGMDVYSILTSS